jgi:hypothetical protein
MRRSSSDDDGIVMPRLQDGSYCNSAPMRGAQFRRFHDSTIRRFNDSPMKDWGFAIGDW